MKEDFILSWKRKLAEKKGQLLAFLDEMREKETNLVDLEAKKAHQKVFSKIDCLDCANCCKSTPALLTKKDIKRIASFIKITPKQFIHKYVIEDINGELSFRKVPCVFLEKDNKCSVYEVRPKACREYPHTDMSRFSFNKRLHQNNLEICPAVSDILEEMKANLE